MVRSRVVALVGMAKCASRLATERETSPSLCLDEPPGALGVAGKQMREALGEGVAGAGWVSAVEAPDRQLQSDRIAADRQVGGPPMAAAMDRRAEGPTRRAAGMIVPSLGENGEGPGAVSCDTNEATAGQWAKQGHALICVLTMTFATDQPSREYSTKPDEEPGGRSSSPSA